jgi:hypothetical protein
MSASGCGPLSASKCLYIKGNHLCTLKPLTWLCCLFRLHDFAVPEQRRESSLKYMTRCVAAYPDGTGYALASVEGRCVGQKV